MFDQRLGGGALARLGVTLWRIVGGGHGHGRGKFCCLGCGSKENTRIVSSI
jgi:hypothetical protein